jgi:hypothetical protein
MCSNMILGLLPAVLVGTIIAAPPQSAPEDVILRIQQSLQMEISQVPAGTSTGRSRRTRMTASL